MRINIYKRACGSTEEDSVFESPGTLRADSPRERARREEILALSAKRTRRGKAKAKASVERAWNTGRASFPFP